MTSKKTKNISTIFNQYLFPAFEEESKVNFESAKRRLFEKLEQIIDLEQGEAIIRT